MRGIAAFALLAMLSAVTSVQADEVPVAPEAPVEAPAASANAADDAVECRVQPITGSHMKKRICMTHHEWELAREQAQSDLQRESTRQGNMRLTPK